MKEKATTRQLRSFGLTVGGIFALIGAWPILARKDDPRLWALALTALLVIPALAFPRSLRPAYRGWMAAGEVLAWINTRLILGTIFFTLFTLTGFVMRLLGKDPMNRKLQPDAESYRVPSRLRPASHMKHQF